MRFFRKVSTIYGTVKPGNEVKMKRFMRKKCLLGLGILFLIVITYFSPASALMLNLTTGGNGWINGDFHSASVPEPATMLLFGAGLIGLGGFRRKIKK